MVYHKEKVGELRPALQASGRAVVERLSKSNHGWIVLEVNRTAYTQVAYAAQGRAPLSALNAFRKLAGLGAMTEPPRKPGQEDLVSTLSTITNCDGLVVQSNHQKRSAMDIAPTKDGSLPWWDAPTDVWLELGAAYEAEGWTWGGRWKDKQKPAAVLGWDCPHGEKA